MSKDNVASGPLPYWQDGGGFFGDLYMEGDDSYEGYLTNPTTLSERTRREVDGVRRLLALQPRAEILDCPCGYGRHSIALARMGFTVEGIDINSEMLGAARRYGQGVENVAFVRKNMLDLDYSNRFDAVVNLFYSFGFFDDDKDNVRALSLFFDSLRPSGQFLFHTDVNIARILSGQYKLSEVRNLKSGRKLAIREKFDQQNRRLHTTWSLDGNARPAAELSGSMRVYTADEFCEMCRSVGFSVVRTYGGWLEEPFTDQSEELIVVASKP